eukprot:6365025-Pyramimonas_sp.AAC.1
MKNTGPPSTRRGSPKRNSRPALPTRPRARGGGLAQPCAPDSNHSGTIKFGGLAGISKDSPGEGDVNYQ